MKWFHIITRVGDRRIIECKFLWFPKRIGNQTRWLERASYDQEYVRGMPYDFWKDSKWI